MAEVQIGPELMAPVTRTFRGPARPWPGPAWSLCVRRALVPPCVHFGNSRGGVWGREVPFPLGLYVREKPGARCRCFLNRGPESSQR